MPTQTWVALLRGINVGGHNRLPMADLRGLLEGLGYTDVSTYLQSGNAVFRAGGKPAAMEAAITKAIASAHILDVAVLVRPGAEFAEVLRDDPFVADGVATKELHVGFLTADPSAARIKALKPEAYLPDEYAFGPRRLYLRLPNGMSGSKSPNWERALGVTVTIRNWNTVTALDGLVRG